MAGGTGYPSGSSPKRALCEGDGQVLLLELGNRHARAHTAEIQPG